jgi:hypothetical protein
VWMASHTESTIGTLSARNSDGEQHPRDGQHDGIGQGAEGRERRPELNPSEPDGEPGHENGPVEGEARGDGQRDGRAERPGHVHPRYALSPASSRGTCTSASSLSRAAPLSIA